MNKMREEREHGNLKMKTKFGLLAKKEKFLVTQFFFFELDAHE